MKIQHLTLGAIAVIGLALGVGCAGAITSTAKTAVYAFDDNDKQILSWDSAETLYAAGSTTSETTIPTPSRAFGSDYLSDFTVAAGGMCVDRSRGRLWMVSTSGVVARIDSIRSRPSGTSLTSTYIRTFQLGTDSSDRLDSGTFGQMAVDVSTGALYITEWSSSDSRIWVLSSPTGYTQDATVDSSSVTLLKTSVDKYGYGVAAANSTIYAYFKTGSTIEDSSGTTYTGARLRMGTASGFSSVIVGSSTSLSGCGTLGADTAHSLIYVAPYNGSGSILVFKTSQFTSGYNQTPKASLPNAASAVSLSAITHPGNKDWVGGVGSSRLLLWKAPSTDTTTRPVAFSDGSYDLQGIALDGSAASD